MNVLFTRELSDKETGLAKSLGLLPQILPLIESHPLSYEAILQECPDFWDRVFSTQSVAFTSQHAVNSLFDENFSNPQNLHQFKLNTTQLLEILKKKPVYTVGEATADALDKFGIMARFPEDYNGSNLAEMMLHDGVNASVLHFCGDIRRKEFKESMLNAGISVDEIVVYHKKEAVVNDLHQIEKSDAIAFYSPSAVEAFWNRGFQERFRGKYYAIGQTTGNALREKEIQPKTPRVPTSELLIRLIAKERV